jgi:hypothetical protein
MLKKTISSKQTKISAAVLCINIKYFYMGIFAYSILMPKKYFVFVFVAISIIQLVPLSILLTFASYASATKKAIPPEDIDFERVSSLINSTMTHVDHTRKAIADGNSAEALKLLTVIRNDLTNIDGNVTDLIFSVSNIPP